MDKKEKKLDYEKPKLEDMSKDRASGHEICSTGSAADECANGTAAGPWNGDSCSVGTGPLAGPG